MFTGHYAVSLAAKRIDARLSLGLLFLAVQFVDILWAVFVLLGVEKVRIVPGFTAASDLDLYYFPYTHSLLASLLWATVIYVVFRLLPAGAGARRSTVAIVLGAAVFSHFVLDRIVHTPDLPLYDNTAKIGLGLWNNAVATYLIEGLILIGGLILYLRSTSATTLTGKYGMIVLVILMLVFNLDTLVGSPPSSPQVVAGSALISYLVLAGIAFWLDRKRSALTAQSP
jgi:hypothetical protein